MGEEYLDVRAVQSEWLWATQFVSNISLLLAAAFLKAFYIVHIYCKHVVFKMILFCTFKGS